MGIAFVQNRYADENILEDELLEIQGDEKSVSYTHLSITHEFTDKISGWNRSRFIPVDYDEDGKLLHVLFCIECIEEEKKRENRLRCV